VGLVLTSFTGLLGYFIFIFTEVHDFAYRWNGIRCDLYEI
jgi:hypothetical protein